MIKKFALLATVAALFVACGSESTEAMENQATEIEATVEESMEQIEAEVDEAVTEGEAMMEEGAEAATEEAVAE